MFNKVMLIGRLGKDVELRNTQGGEKVANFSVATTESWKDRNSGERKEKTEWHNVVVWGPAAEVADKYLAKGDRVGIEGKIQTRKWTDKSGNDRYSTEVVISGPSHRLILIETKSDRGGGSQREESHRGGFGAFPDGDLDDEIPF